MDRRNTIIALFAMLCACGGPTNTNVANVANNESDAPVQPVENTAAPLTPPEPGTPGGLPDDKTPVEEPKGPIDPKSAEAAGQVMQHYGALLEQGRFAEARRLWGDGGRASNLTEQKFADQFAKYSEVHAQVGKPGDTEGAAGSIYVTVPFQLYGRLKSGGQFNRSGAATLRRVNDVPGSTAAQRRWHIAQIEFDGAG
jgi:hypothetical protein